MIFDLFLITSPLYYVNSITSERSNDNQDTTTTLSNLSPFLNNFILDIIWELGSSFLSSPTFDENANNKPWS